MIERLGQDWEGGNWVNDWKITFSYDANGNMVEELDQSWAGVNWVNFSLYTYTYDVNGNMIEQISQDWEGGNWVNYSLCTYTYDANGNMIELLGQYWAGGNWVNECKDTYSYNANGNMIEDLEQIWEGGTWVNSYRWTYTYEETAVDENEFSQVENNLSSYPNPFNPDKIGTTISFNLLKRAVVSLTIYNIKGQIVKTLINNSILDRDTHNYIWNGKDENGESVKNGIYFYKLQVGNNTAVKKMLLLH